MRMQKMLSTIMMASTMAMSLATVAAPIGAMAAETTATTKPAITADELFAGDKPGAKATNISSELGLSSADIRVTIARIIRVAMGLLGIVAVVIVLIGGFTWMTAGGNDEKVAEAKKWIFAGIIGLAIILSAFAISSFVINSLVTATTGTDTAATGVQ